jgi:SpoVK/Ycf46/Vps4 family AAA+-type ATPase
MTLADELLSLLRSGYGLIAALTWEEERVEAAVAAIAKATQRTARSWSSARGIGGQAKKPSEVLEAIAADPGPSIWLLKDFHAWLDDPLVVRALRDLTADPKAASRAIVLVGPSLAVPRELEKDVAVVEVALPSADELEKALSEMAAGAPPASQEALRTVGAASVAQAAKGLTLREARRAFRRALDPAIAKDASVVATVAADKRKQLRSTRFLEYFEPSGAIAGLGGLGELKRWLQTRAVAFKPEARSFGLPQPKGVFLLGVQGCGKSLAAKAAAELWDLPLLRFDAGAVVDGGGEGPAGNLRQALAIAEALAPCVLWLDEIEKVFAMSAVSESSAISRVLGAFITWLQEKKEPVFVVATANRVDALPPELMRKGRFDEVFFVDLPGLHDRKEILSIHLMRRGRDPAQMGLDALAKATEKFSGAELEAAVVSAMFAAYSEKRDINARDLKVAIDETVPLAVTMEEEVRALKDWAKGRTRAAALDTRRADLFGETA